MEEQSTVTTQDRNLVRKMEATRSLQQLLHYATQPTFSGFVSVRVHANAGRITKIVKNSEEHDGYA
jgi:hypothetical protein